MKSKTELTFKDLHLISDVLEQYLEENPEDQDNLLSLNMWLTDTLFDAVNQMGEENEEDKKDNDISKALKSSREDTRGAIRTLARYLDFIKDMEDRQERAEATLDFAAFTVASAIYLNE